MKAKGRVIETQAFLCVCDCGFDPDAEVTGFLRTKETSASIRIEPASCYLARQPLNHPPTGDRECMVVPFRRWRQARNVNWRCIQP